jgi:Protein of unknown function (DUF1302)
MGDRSLRASALAGLLIATLAGVRAARAQGGTDGGAPAPAAGAPSVNAPPDGGAPPAEAAPAESGGGLFEESQAATAASAAAEAVLTAPKAPFTLNGYVRGDVFVGKTQDVRAAEMKANYGELGLQLRTAKTAFGDGFTDVRFRYGLQGSAPGTFVDIREAYVNAYLGPFDLRLGKQIIVWGRADALNPTNNLTPVDFRIRSPLEDDIRLGNVGARAFLRLGIVRLEGAWMPTYLATELPNVGLPPDVVFAPPIFPSPDLKNGLVAGRIHLELPAFETSISYLRGYAPLPGLTLTGLRFSMTDPAVFVSRTAYNQQVLGFDFSTALGDVLTLRGEAAYRRPFDWQNRPYAARPDVQYALGADHTFGSVSIIVQYLGRYVFNWQKEPGTNRDPGELAGILANPDNQAGFTDLVTTEVSAELAQINQILFSQTARVQHIATLRFEWLALHEALSISSLCLYNFTTQEWLITPRIGWKLTDAMTAFIGAQVFAGPNDTLFGLIDQNLSAGYVELRFSF